MHIARCHFSFFFSLALSRAREKKKEKEKVCQSNIPQQMCFLDWPVRLTIDLNDDEYADEDRADGESDKDDNVPGLCRSIKVGVGVGVGLGRAREKKKEKEQVCKSNILHLQQIRFLDRPVRLTMDLNDDEDADENADACEILADRWQTFDRGVCLRSTCANVLLVCGKLCQTVCGGAYVHFFCLCYITVSDRLWPAEPMCIFFACALSLLLLYRFLLKRQRQRQRSFVFCFR
jgi:hypothetical protein